MPIYEYRCRKCGHQFEKIRKFSDPPLKKCPECGGELELLLSAPAIQFKGTGWYVTDYARKSSGGDGAKPDGGSKKSEPAPAAKSSESKTSSKD